MQRAKVFMVMIDGVSADYFANHRNRYPNLSALAENGFLVKRMRSPFPATSMPGRASILTGDSTVRHGIYGNRILVNGEFVPPQAEDVKTRTIALRAHEAGLDVACIGHALVDPEHTSVYVPPCWLRSCGFMKQGDQGARLLNVKDPQSRLAGVPLGLEATAASKPDDVSRITNFLWGDQSMIAAATALACSSDAPDLILTEVNLTDTYQHEFGYESREAHFSVAFADLLVGQITSQLARAGRLSEYAIAITSDHGHGPVHTAIYPDRVIPDAAWATEGAVLHVQVSSKADVQSVTARLSEFGVEPCDSIHVSEDDRTNICTFTAPPGHDFEAVPSSTPSDQFLGKSKHLSTHGFWAGAPFDDRICIFSGKHVPQGSCEIADETQFASTIGELLKLPKDFSAASLFEAQ
ncbi:alkaline phosphatase family protein [Mesorhizobium delmotii]|uniref:Type I phosphodiesterase/nucleotide pyrophosphatase n=1 Tax=Mesorhizobium delmotii TaxID=1631247 RepID=A0A2P9AMX6_9HYPH|nr:alkaline phosphatase family protein [Mesorhizobium delmotii]SJM32502.1 conserved hypothetical protein [Mesorhizobium delmotii]